MKKQDLSELLFVNYGEYKSPKKFRFIEHDKPTVSLIIPVYNKYEMTRDCLYSILQHTHNINYEVIIADDSSVDETKNIGKNIAGIIHVRMKKNSGFGANVTNAINHASGKYIALLNNDMLFYDNWLKPIIDVLESDKTIGAAGGTLVSPDGLVNELGGMLDTDGRIVRIGRGCKYTDKLSEINNVNFDYKSGCCLILQKKLWNKLGGFDVALQPAYYEDTDLCFRINEMGLRVVNVFESRIIHFETVSYDSVIDKTKMPNIQYFYNKWKKVLCKLQHKQKFDCVEKRYAKQLASEHVFFKYRRGKYRDLFLFGMRVCSYIKSGNFMKFVEKKEFIDNDIHINKYYFCGIRVLKKVWSPKYKTTYILNIKVRHKHLCGQNNIIGLNRYVNTFLSDDNQKTYVPIAESDYKRKKGDPMLLAYYLTQFHETKINNENFGKGFTEWTNVAKAKPLFSGHYQPHIPIDVGFYDLAHDDVMYRQIELAKKYGIGGFCFYYYWFSGKRLLEKPLFNFLNNPELDFPFCLFWANETWQRRWFGGNKEILMEHKFDVSMVEKFFNDILPFFQDKRYIKVNNKPFLILYHYYEFTPDQLHEIKSKLNELAKLNGFDGIHFVAQGFKIPDDIVSDYGLDGISEFCPCGCGRFLEKYKLGKDSWLCPQYTGNMFDVGNLLKQWEYKTNYTLYKCCFPSWDNTPRSFTNANMYLGMTPSLYANWLKKVILWTKKHNDSQNQFVFINAWNEWGEGAHLEPDLKYGYAWLQATRYAIEGSRK